MYTALCCMCLGRWCFGLETRVIIKIYPCFVFTSDSLTTIPRLSLINVLYINLSYSPKDQSLKFWRKNIENWGSLKNSVGHFGFFLHHPHENQSKVLGYQEWVEILMITLVSSQKSPTPNISAPSAH